MPVEAKRHHYPALALAPGRFISSVRGIYPCIAPVETIRPAQRRREQVTESGILCVEEPLPAADTVAE
jgi:hypothetical protein